MAYKKKQIAISEGVSADILLDNEMARDAIIQNGFAEAAGFGQFNAFGLPSAGGFPGSEQISNTGTLFKNLRWYLVTNFRQLLSELYVEIGLVQTIVDLPVEDALKGGIDVKTKQLDEDQIKELQMSIDRDGDLRTVGQAAKWNRLFGGAGVIFMTDQDPETPFDISSIGPDDEFSLRAADVWELFWTTQNTEGYDPSIQYDNFEFYNYYGENIHKSRVMPMKGLEAPSFIRPRLRGWGFSVCEKLVRSINQYLKGTDLGFEVLDEFKLDVYKIKNLVNTLNSPNGQQKIQQRIQIANYQKNYQNAVVMDSEDEFDHKQLSFAGLAEAMAGIRKQVSADMRIPSTKLFGSSEGGGGIGNADQNDMENYNSMVETEVRDKIKYDILRVCEVKCQRLFGFIPDDLEVFFKPLRVLTAEQEENVKNAKFQRLATARSTGEISTLEFREACNKGNLLDIILDTKGDALDPNDPGIDEVVDDKNGSKDSEEKRDGEYGGSPTLKKNSDKWEEGKHPRSDDGKFGSGGGGDSSGSSDGDGGTLDQPVKTKGEGSEIFEKDKEEAVNKLLTIVPDKDYDAFMDKIDSELGKAKIGKIDSEQAAKIKRSHNFTFESDPDNKSMHRGKGLRGKELKDPSVVVEFEGEYYALDGQHRLNDAIKGKKPANVAIVNIDFMKKMGMNKEFFAGKKTFNNIQLAIQPFSEMEKIVSKLSHIFNSAAFDRASYAADGGDAWIDSRRRELFENPGGVDEALWSKAQEASKAAFGEVKWQFVTWFYKKQGGKFK